MESKKSKQLRCIVEGIAFDEEEKPGYDQGREMVVEPQARSSAEIMKDNGAFGSKNMEEEKREEPAPA